jgi:PKD repeat protein
MRLKRALIGTILSLILLWGCSNRPSGGVYAIFTASPERGDPPLEVLFDASESYATEGEIVTYYWDFGDGTSSEGVQVWHTYTKPGRYTVMLTVVTDRGGSDTAYGLIIVEGTPPIAIIQAPTEAPCWETVTFDATEAYDPDGIIMEYYWDFGDGTSGEGPIVHHQFPWINCDEPPRTYIVTLRVVDNDGLEATATHEITILPVCLP